VQKGVVEISQNNIIKERIYSLRSQQIMLDRDLADFYQIKTKALNQAVKRNEERFPEEFMFQLTQSEKEELVTHCDHLTSLKFSSKLPYAFTEQGVAMLSSVLHSKKAIKTSIRIMRSFVQMRKFFHQNDDILERVNNIETRCISYDLEFSKIFSFLEKKEEVPEKGIFFEGQIFDAHIFLSTLIRKAKKKIVLVDNYIDERTLQILSKRKTGVCIILYSKKISDALRQDIEIYSKQNGQIQCCVCALSHDRFLIIDDDVYLLGASLKDAGKKWFGFSNEDTSLLDKKLVGGEEEKSDLQKLKSNLFQIQENFPVEAEMRERAQKFGVGLEFDYNEPSHKLGVSDFTLYFNQRLAYFTKLLKGRLNMDNVLRISQLKDLFSSNNQVDIIGLVSEISETKKGHFMVTVEDKSGEIKCFVNKDKTDMVKQIQNFCLDEGIGVRGKIGDNIIWTDEFVIPTPPNATELKKTDEEHYVVFLSDIHFGAKVFVDEAFQKFIDWIRGESQSEKLNKIAKKVKYVVIAGDLIEGIGIYPNQGKDARILSTELQYHECARWLSMIPEDIAIIIIPGNHDTDRLSEPQPKLPYHKTYSLYHMPNVIMMSNPSIARLFENDPCGGLDFYLYHGGSIFYYADKIQSLREKGGPKVPEEVIKFLLEKRHLAPSHGSTLYIPDSQRDPLVIQKMPDFFITGHTHKLSLANYKGCTIISCGCWVEMSDYQEKMGMYPDVGKCVIVNTKTRKPNILNFYTEKYKLEQEAKEKAEKEKAEKEKKNEN